MDDGNESSWSEMKERAHYLSWLATAILMTALLGLTFDLLVVRFSGGDVGIDMAVLVYLCAVLSPAVYAWRKHGEAYCRFIELEAALDSAVSHRREPAPLFEQILDLIEQIDRSRGMERQAIRNEAKQWLLLNASRLTRDEREFVAEHLGYLQRQP